MSPKSGLSLLELLVSLALLALVGAGLAGAFGLGTQLWTRTEALSANRQEIALRSQVRQYMSQALSPTRLTPFDQPFSGGQNTLSFITLADTPFAPNAAAMRMTIALNEGTLTLRTDLLNDNAETFQTWTDPLARSVAGLRIEYWDRDTSDWQTQWSNDAELPILIRIRMDEGSDPDWPDFIVRPLLQ